MFVGVFSDKSLKFLLFSVANKTENRAMKGVAIRYCTVELLDY